MNSAKRIWTTKHTENVMLRVHEAEETLGLAEKYMGELGRGIDTLSKIRLTDRKIMEFMAEFFPVTADLPDVQRKNNLRLLEGVKQQYWGTQLESIVRAEFTKRTGIEVCHKDELLQSEEHPFMLANLDGICEVPDVGTCIFEAKTASAYKAGEWEDTK